jgi:hypothetical protein
MTLKTYLLFMLLIASPALAGSPVIAHVGQVCDAYWLNSVSVHKDGTVTHDIKEAAEAAKECNAVGAGHCLIVNVCEAMRRLAHEAQQPTTKPTPGEQEL